MSDAVYRRKYSRTYEPGEKIPRMAKQMDDARDVADRGGLYLDAGASRNPPSLGGELGLFRYKEPWREYRVGIAGLAGTGARDWFVGLDGGMRLQTPTRVAPFIGFGGFGGSGEREVAAIDGRDNDDDIFVDEPGETKTELRALFAVYPEVGVHAWLTPRCRLSGFGRYYVTTDGRASDFWYVGLGISLLESGRVAVRLPAK
jgi:hypothetical protein